MIGCRKVGIVGHPVAMQPFPMARYCAVPNLACAPSQNGRNRHDDHQRPQAELEAEQFHAGHHTRPLSRVPPWLAHRGRTRGGCWILGRIVADGDSDHCLLGEGQVVQLFPFFFWRLFVHLLCQLVEDCLIVALKRHRAIRCWLMLRQTA
jgi:hypothetical protein